MKKILFLTLTFALSLFSGQRASAETFSGSCGENVIWSFDSETGVLEITGTGAITNAGWSDYVSQITSVVIGEGITSVRAKIFEENNTLLSVSIPSTVTSIGVGAFSCQVLESMSVAEGNTVYDSRENCNGIIETATNTLVSGCKNTVIPESVTAIGQEAFYYCTSLERFTVPSSVTAIGSSAFASCSTLVELNLPEGLAVISRQMLDDCVSLKRLVVPSTVTSIESFAFDNCSSLKSVAILPAEAPEVGYDAFRDCSSSVVLYYNNDSEGYEAIANSFGIKAFNVAENRYYFDAADGLPGAFVDNRFVWESPLVEFSEPIDAVRFTFFRSGEYVNYDIFSMAELELFDGEGNRIEYTASNVITNSLQCDDGDGLAALCDGDADTYYHSYWSGSSSNNIYQGDELVYLEIALPEPVASFKFKHTARNAHSTQLPTYLCVNVGGFKGVPGTSGSCGDNITWSFDEETGTLTFEGNGVLNSSGYNYWSRNVNKVVVGEGITAVGASAFESFYALTEVEILGTVTSIGDSAFEYCRGLMSIELPEGLTSIGSYAFRECDVLENLVLPSGLITIEDRAFAGCDALTSILIPASVTSIGVDAFAACDALEGIVVAEGNTVYDSRESCNAIIETATNTLIAGCKNTTIPGDITIIASCAFYDCDGLTAVELPVGLTRIGGDAFYDCDGLTSVEIPSTVTIVGNQAFRGCNGLTSVVISEGVANIGYGAFSSCSNLANIEIPSSVTSIYDNVFTGCAALESIVVAEGNTVYDSRENCNAIIKTATKTLIAGCKNSTIPEGVTSIGSYAFEGCYGLDEMEIPSTVTAIGRYAFYNCDGLTAIELPAGLTSIGNGAFHDCDGLTSIEIPGSVTSIGGSAFYSCNGLQTVISNSIVAPELGNNAFWYISSSAVLRYPACCDYTAWEEFFASTEAIGTVQEGTCGESLTWHFNENIGLLRISGTGEMYDYDSETSPQPWSTLGVNTVLIDEGVTNIGNYAFYNCSSLTRIEIPEGVTSFGNYAFYNCSSLTSIEIPVSVTRIGTSASMFNDSNVFRGCNSLEAVHISDLAAWCRIDFGDGGYATANPLFYAHNLYLNGELITELVIPAEITEIKPFAFGGAGITSVTMHEGVTEIGQDAFKRCTALSNVVIPDGVAIIRKGAFYECSELESVTIGTGVTRVDEGAFGGCDKLNAVYISDLEAWCGIDFYSYPNFNSNPLSFAGNLYLNGELLTELVIPESIAEIKQGVFYGATAIKSITLHEGVSTIGEKAFYGCSAVECITSCIPAENLFELGDGVMTGINLFECILYVPYSAASTYAATAGWMDFENIVEMEPTEITVKVNQYGSGTFCSEYDLDFTAVEGLKAYVVNGYNISNQMVTLQRVKTVKAGVGLFIKGEPGEYIVPVIERSDDNYMNMLVGTLEVTTLNSVSDDGVYYNYKYTILSGDTSPKFYRFGDGNRYSANRAYLQIPAAWLSSSSTSIGVRFDDGEATGVDDVVEEFDGGTAVYYDLNGRVVLNPTNGIYIVNGKKVVVNDK